MKWRKISEEEVRQVIEKPDVLSDSIKERKNAQSIIGERLLKVTFKEELDRIAIITVIDKTN